MNVTKYFTKYGRKFIIDLSEEKLGEVFVSSHLGESNTWSIPTVTWGGCGNVDFASTETFRTALGIATNLYLIINANFSNAQLTTFFLNSGLSEEDINLGN